MADNQILGAIIGRLSRVRAIESQLVDRFEQLRTAGAIDPEEREAFTRQSALAARHGLALEEVAGPGGAELKRSEPTGGHRGSEHALSVLLEDAIAAAASAVVAYGALYASARLLYENDVCDLADAHAAEWAVELAALNDLLAPAVHAELLSGGLTCRCVCPTCGIGACGCTRNSIDTIRGYWGQPELEPSDGLVLRVPPRPGSQLAEAGLERGDRIIAVDGQLVHINAEIQRALRGHPIGESMTMQVIRAGEPREIRVARVSDLPS
jgi:membrane-associated protease RseP (regulator of RpoE activity)